MIEIKEGNVCFSIEIAGFFSHKLADLIFLAKVYR
jgi:hypothetical protein